MAIFHLSMKPVQRSAGRSAAASAAYRSGESIPDPRQGVTWEYSRRADRVQDTGLFAAGVPAHFSRAALWGEIEVHHKRKDACTAREIEVALPHELSPEYRRKVTREFARLVSEIYGVAVDYSIHTSEGREKNWHAHLLCTTVTVDPKSMEFGKKNPLFDPHECGKEGAKKPADLLRPLWAEAVNAELRRFGYADTLIDHRSHADRGLDQLPTVHEGPEFSPGRAGRQKKNEERRAINAEIKTFMAELGEEQRREDVERADLARKAAIEQAEIARREASLGTREPDGTFALTIRGVREVLRRAGYRIEYSALVDEYADPAQKIVRLLHSGYPDEATEARALTRCYHGAMERVPKDEATWEAWRSVARDIAAETAINPPVDLPAPSPTRPVEPRRDVLRPRARDDGGMGF